MVNPISLTLQNKTVTAKCPDCDSILNIPYDIEEGEILSCPGCGLELEVKKPSKGGEYLNLQELIIEGEDWGE